MAEYQEQDPTPGPIEPKEGGGTNGVDEVKELGPILQQLDVIPDDIPVAGELDDQAIVMLRDLSHNTLEYIADELGAQTASPESILREVIDGLESEESTAKIAQALDQLIVLPEPMEGLDGVVFNELADYLAAYIADHLREAVS